MTHDETSQDGDVENQANVDEETPLLESPQSDSPSDEPEQKDNEPKQASWYIWRALWAIIAILIFVVFIKGWIDAGSDVNVCTRTRYLQAFCVANVGLLV